MRIFRAALFATAAPLLITSAVAAEYANTIDEIVVTARRREELIQAVPIAINAYTQADLDKQGVEVIEDLRFVAPSVYIQTDVYQQNTVNVTIRGQRNFASNGIGNGVQFDTSTAIYLNGIYLARTQGLTGALFDVETVQVLKGPQGTLVGRNATGGAILYATREPEFRYGGWAEATGGSYGRRELQGAVNVPFTETIAARAAISFTEHDGWLKNIYQDPFYGIKNDKPAFGSKKLAGQFSVKWSPDETFKVVLRGDFQSADYSGTGYHSIGYFIGTVPSQGRPSVCNIPGSCSVVGGVPGQGNTDLLGHYIAPHFLTPPTTVGGAAVVNTDPRAYNSLLNSLARQQAAGFWTTDQAVSSRNYDHVQSVSGLIDKTFGDINVKLVTGYRWFDTSGVSASRGLPYNVVQTSYAVPDYHAYNSDLTVNGNLLEDALKWTAGAFVFTEKSSGGLAQYLGSPHFTGPQAVAGRQVTLSDLIDNSGANKSYALYGQATYAILPELRVTGGARYSIDKRRAHIVSQTVRFPATPTTNALVRNAVFNPAPYVLNGISYPGSSTFCAMQDSAGVPLPLADCMLDVARTFKQPTWMLSLDYDLPDGTLVYATTRRGYRSGGINAGQNGTNADLLVAKPEKVQDFEIGMKSDFLAGGVPTRLNIDAYYTDYRDIQSQVELPFVALATGPGGGPCTQAAFDGGQCAGTTTQAVMVNARKAEVWGFEWDLQARPVPEFTLSTGGSYLHAFYRDFTYNIPPGYLAPAGGVRLNNTPFPLPQWQINAGAIYALTGQRIGLPIGEISLGAQWYWQSTVRADYSGIKFPERKALGYQFTNLRLNITEIAGTAASLSGAVTNLFNKAACLPEYNGALNNVPNATQNTPNTSGIVQCVPAPPRQFSLTLRYSF